MRCLALLADAVQQLIVAATNSLLDGSVRLLPGADGAAESDLLLGIDQRITRDLPQEHAEKIAQTPWAGRAARSLPFILDTLAIRADAYKIGDDPRVGFRR